MATENSSRHSCKEIPRVRSSERTRTRNVANEQRFIRWGRTGIGRKGSLTDRPTERWLVNLFPRLHLLTRMTSCSVRYSARLLLQPPTDFLVRTPRSRLLRIAAFDFNFQLLLLPIHKLLFDYFAYKQREFPTFDRQLLFFQARLHCKFIATAQTISSHLAFVSIRYIAARRALVWQLVSLAVEKSLGVLRPHPSAIFHVLNY